MNRPVPPAPSDAATRLARRAEALDAADPLRGVRDRFVLDEAVYLDGNSLGALPRSVPDRVAEVVAEEWGRLRIRSWTESGWDSAPERIGDRLAPLLGAAPGQVVVGDSTSVNLFKLLVGAVRLAGDGRDEILLDADTFPTDRYVAESAARMTGRRLRALPPAGIAAEAGARTAVALVNHVDYRSGELRDLPALTAALHEAGALALWDLCHSAGALPVELDRHAVDLAVGCGYKYLNGGPGAPAFAYVRAAHLPRFDSPLPGWWGHRDPFAMSADYAPHAGARRLRVGTPDILSMLALEAALDAFDGVELAAVRAKSLALTDFFLECVGELVPEGAAEPLTPAEHARRGSQVSLRCPDAAGLLGRLVARGVVADHRPPDVLRFGFAPLYTGFAEAARAAATLGELLGASRRGPAGNGGR
ncbi:kynureninase [Streptomyces sp. 3MP-14]|uniref:Kynureninase n=1 Tax=Streptomyces mimosae TaxID=2586635 RepID=A0A5N5ZZS0_9ACTN|nr:MULTISPECIES: kynureninase [Streptomyces]KAB8161765.1 kynureninase [Streptomyces mimosae]KAB8174967.1 kynureninase [Streptomyces sp. 3MP-14]